MTTELQLPVCKLSLTLSVLLCISIAGCSQTPELNSTQTGALAGTALGAGVGAIIGDQVGHTGSGTAIGAGIGALGGALIGGQADRQNDRLSEQDERLRRQEEEIRRQRRELEDLRRGDSTKSDYQPNYRDSYRYPSGSSDNGRYDDRGGYDSRDPERRSGDRY